MRWALLKNNKIVSISNHPFSQPCHTAILPDELDAIDGKVVINEYRISDGYVVPARNRKIKDLKIAIITNWEQHCGISIYAEHLVPHFIDKCKDYKIFCEINDKLTDQASCYEGASINREKVIECWRRGESLQNLASEVQSFNPDIVWINHEPGIFPNARYWLSFLTQLSSYRIITTLHSVYPTHYDKTIVEAPLKEIIVHLDGAKKALIDKGISGEISVIQHGYYKNEHKPKLWNFYKSQHTFMQSGFLFPYKGLETSIEAASILKPKYPDVYLTILGSENENNRFDHNKYHDELIDFIKKLGLEDNASIVRGFQTDQSLDSYYRTNQVAVFPYKSDPDHIVFGASGAVRLAISKNIPVITSKIHHFSDVPSIKIETAAELAEELDKLFSDNNLVKNRINIQNKCAEDNSWEKAAIRYIEIFES